VISSAISRSSRRSRKLHGRPDTAQDHHITRPTHHAQHAEDQTTDLNAYLVLYLAGNRVLPDSVQSSSERRRAGLPMLLREVILEGRSGSPRRVLVRRVWGYAAMLCGPPAAMTGFQVTR
jgi:hypothetical protein